jgi:hypothetical protein
MALVVPVMDATVLPVEGMLRAISLLESGGLSIRADRVEIYGRDPLAGEDPGRRYH